MPQICPHLEPRERAIAGQGVALGTLGASPYGEYWGLWAGCPAVFADSATLRARLALDDFITCEEYDGSVAGSDAAFYCPRRRRAIMGTHPHHASRGTARIV